MSKTEGCKTQILKNTTLTAALLLSTQGSVMAAPVVSYVMTGSFNTPGVLEVSDANTLWRQGCKITGCIGIDSD